MTYSSKVILDHCDLPGRSTGKSYWKVIQEKQLRFGDAWYLVVKCTRLGKEFKQENRFNAKALELMAADKFTNVPTNDKSDIAAGIASGRKKRRIAYLKQQIAKMQMELDNLEGGQ